MWYLSTHILVVCFSITAVLKFLAIWGPDMWRMFWRGEMPYILDFSPLKFLMFAVVYSQLRQSNWPTVLLVTTAFFYYSWWLIVSTRYLRQRYSWPRVAWMIVSHIGGPWLGWSKTS